MIVEWSIHLEWWDSGQRTMDSFWFSGVGVVGRGGDWCWQAYDIVDVK